MALSCADLKQGTPGPFLESEVQRVLALQPCLATYAD